MYEFIATLVIILLNKLETGPADYRPNEPNVAVCDPKEGLAAWAVICDEYCMLKAGA